MPPLIDGLDNGDAADGRDPGAVLDLLRARVERGQAPAFWKSLDAIADTDAFRRHVEREYPAAAHLAAGPDRRGFFRLMAASFAMTGLAACDSTEDGRRHEVPYVRQPERLEPGVPLQFASATLVDGYANGVLVTTVNGRPIKIEGNPQHPWSRGGTDIFGQASVLGLYDPARSQTVRLLDRISDWDSFRNRLLGPVAAHRADGGKGLRFLTGPITSPSTIALLQTVLRDLPQARWHMMGAPGGVTAERGVAGDIRLHFDKARVVVAIGGDFLDHGPAQVGMSRRFYEARAARAAAGDLLALHSAAATPSLTSAKADHHIALETPALAGLVSRLAEAVDRPTPTKAVPTTSDPVARWVERAADALRRNKGASIVTAGMTQSPAVAAAVHRLNAALGNFGTTVTVTDPVLPAAAPLDALVDDMHGGAASSLIMLDCDPVHDAPGSLDFATALSKVTLKIHAGSYVDATAIRVDWHLPLAHPLEGWNDARAVDGTAGLIQPTVRPLGEGRTTAEIVSMLFETEARDALTIVKAHWQGSDSAVAFEPRWRQALLDGFWPQTAAAERASTELAHTVATPSAAASTPPLDIRPDALDLVFRLGATVRDVKDAANAWLQELPDPLTKVTWDNVVAVSPQLAASHKLSNGDIVAIRNGAASVEGAVWVLPGQASRTVTLTLGYGRSAPDMIFDGIGYNANKVRSAAEPWAATGATLEKTGRRAQLATTQDHNTMEGHDFIKVQPVGGAPVSDESPRRSFYGADPAAPTRTRLNADVPVETRAWGMVIDTDVCTGCGACVVACQAENNIAVVGKEQVALGRDMHWLRIDRYYSAAKTSGLGLDDPDTHFQPVPCMHCELAPCEVGCPVEATLHDHEGLNLMVYNRCVGTRACSGYCPYKVRRFNYLDYSAGESPSVQTRNNPDVTVRARGVMEKCTYCVQRIATARIQSDKSGEPIADGSVVTACQGACPTRAISFGDLADATAAVNTARRDSRHYDLLGELNLRPRTTYLAERAPARADGNDSAAKQAGRRAAL